MAQIPEQIQREAEEWARDTERDNDHDTTLTWRDYYPHCLAELLLDYRLNTLVDD
jgi:hypothetical protein